jgi:diguanylate cyclase (GGDEF)-like protein
MVEKNGEIKRIDVLLIEDNPDDVFLIQEILNNTNGHNVKYKIICVDRLEKGLAILGKEGIDLVLLDLMLPDTKGIETLTRLYHMSDKTPIVVLTAIHDEGTGKDILSKGAQDYLVKGQLNYAILTRTILHAIERHKIRHEQISMAHELRLANARLEKLVFSDPLTGLINRRGLQDSLSREIQRSSRGREELLALILDLDNFKQINDLLGHAVGDIVLKDIAKNLLRCVRVTDYVSRIGGDEFLILMPDTRFAEGARLSEKIRRTLAESPVPLSMGPIFRITGSFGLLRVSPDTLSIDELLAQTHHVLKHSKQMGKNQISYGSTREEAENGYSGQVANILQSLRSGEQFKALRQPIFDLKRMKPIGYEFLSRFTGAGLEMPDDFFRVALENNILTTVDSQCLKNCVALGSALPKQFKQHVNLFPSTLIDVPSRQLIDIFARSSSEAEYCIEISEQQIIGDPSYLSEPVLALKDAGIEIAIDDVGFGRSSFESLILLEPDVVKIDKKWVIGIAKNPGAERSIKRLRKVAESLSTELVAEGIETEEDMKALISLGIKFGQGYFLGRPS